jgi:hypothetical protein
VAAAILAPLLLVSSGGFASSTRAAASTQSTIFQPWQVWWFFGWHGPLVHGLFGLAKPGYRSGPGWTGAISHPLIVVVGLGLAGILWLRGRRGSRVLGEREALLLLALVLLLRCVLDTWDTGYYMLPFSISLLAWEAVGERKPPILALLGTVLTWLALEQLSARGASPDMQAAVFLAWTLPLAALFALRLFAPGLRIGLPGSRPLRSGVHASERTPTPDARLSALSIPTTPAVQPNWIAPTQETTVSSLGNPVSTS